MPVLKYYERNGKRISKVLVAEALWPALERKISAAAARHDPSAVPILAVVHRVAELVSRISKRTFMLVYEADFDDDRGSSAS